MEGMTNGIKVGTKTRQKVARMPIRATSGLVGLLLGTNLGNET